MMRFATSSWLDMLLFSFILLFYIHSALTCGVMKTSLRLDVGIGIVQLHVCKEVTLLGLLGNFSADAWKSKLITACLGGQHLQS